MATFKDAEDSNERLKQFINVNVGWTLDNKIHLNRLECILNSVNIYL